MAKFLSEPQARLALSPRASHETWELFPHRQHRPGRTPVPTPQRPQAPVRSSQGGEQGGSCRYWAQRFFRQPRLPCWPRAWQVPGAVEAMAAPAQPTPPHPIWGSGNHIHEGQVRSLPTMTWQFCAQLGPGSGPGCPHTLPRAQRRRPSLLPTSVVLSPASAFTPLRNVVDSVRCCTFTGWLSMGPLGAQPLMWPLAKRTQQKE